MDTSDDDVESIIGHFTKIDYGQKLLLSMVTFIFLSSLF